MAVRRLGLRVSRPGRLHVPRGRPPRSRTCRPCRQVRRPAKNPAWLNDPLLYHNRGNTSFTGENSLYGDFFGLDDLWTERREVVDGMVDVYSSWIEEFGVDGFRIDTTKHVNLGFWQVFGPDILAGGPRRREARLLRVRRGLRPAVRLAVHEPVLDGAGSSSRRSTSASSSRRGTSRPRAARPTTSGRSSSPTTGTRTPTATRTRSRRSSATTTWAGSATSSSGWTRPAPSDAELLAVEARARADVLRTGSAGDLLRRRAGVHRRRRRQARRARTCSPTPCPTTRTTTSSGPTRPRRTTTSTVPSAVQGDPPYAKLYTTTRRCGPGAQIHRYSSDGPGCTRSPGSTATSGSSTWWR